ncbi:MAG: 3-ketoacyl-ACP reductase [Bacteroides sp. SM23_62_1]|nr:MAG: 3-ketoacyl-ACP reductase [Bacteroides sp. SM23_62_1]
MRKVVLITGGSRGIGLGIANEFAINNYDIAIMGRRNTGQVSEVMNELGKTGADVLYIRGDVSSSSDRRNCIKTIRSHFGMLNILINNAGMAPGVRKDILQSTEASFDEVLNVNLKGPYFLTQQVANWMIDLKKENKRFETCIINISSVSATIVSTNRGEYCISKAGMSMMTQLFSVRLGEYGIPVYEIRPGIIMTDMTARVKDKYDRMIKEGLTILPRWGMPADVGKAALALANGNFNYSTGQVIMVDGGMTLQKI